MSATAVIERPAQLTEGEHLALIERSTRDRCVLTSYGSTAVVLHDDPSNEWAYDVLLLLRLTEGILRSGEACPVPSKAPDAAFDAVGRTYARHGRVIVIDGQARKLDSWHKATAVFRILTQAAL